MELAVEMYQRPITNRQIENYAIIENPAGSRQKIEETLENFGMLKNETKVYLYLAEEGSKKAKDICEALKIHRTETYRILHHLEKKGLVYAELEKPVKFSAIPLDKGIDSLVETQKTKIQMLQNQKDALVDLWLSMPQQKRQTVQKQLFQKLEGEQRIILKANEILEAAKKEIQLYVTDEYLAELYYGSFFDKVKRLRGKLQITLMTGSSVKSKYFLEKLRWPTLNHDTVDDPSLPCFIIADRQELLIAFSEEEHGFELGHRKKVKSMAVWTNYQSVVSMLEMLFLKLSPPL